MAEIGDPIDAHPLNVNATKAAAPNLENIAFISPPNRLFTGRLP
jgi:hypothetical protein